MVRHTKGGNIIWNFGGDHIIKEKEYHKEIVLRGFDYNFFEEEEFGGVIKVIYEYAYLKHLIELCPGYQENNLGEINESVYENSQN